MAALLLCARKLIEAARRYSITWTTCTSPKPARTCSPPRSERGRKFVASRDAPLRRDGAGNRRLVFAADPATAVSDLAPSSHDRAIGAHCGGLEREFGEVEVERQLVRRLPISGKAIRKTRRERRAPVVDRASDEVTLVRDVEHVRNRARQCEAHRRRVRRKGDVGLRLYGAYGERLRPASRAEHQRHREQELLHCVFLLRHAGGTEARGVCSYCVYPHSVMQFVPMQSSSASKIGGHRVWSSRRCRRQSQRGMAVHGGAFKFVHFLSTAR